jgi:hypothetical protein
MRIPRQRNLTSENSTDRPSGKSPICLKTKQIFNDASSFRMTFATGSGELANSVVVDDRAAEPSNRLVPGDSKQPQVPPIWWLGRGALE